MAEITQTYGYFNTATANQRLVISQSLVLLDFGSSNNTLSLGNKDIISGSVDPLLLFNSLSIDTSFVNKQILTDNIYPDLLLSGSALSDSVSLRDRPTVSVTQTVVSSYQFWN